MEARWPRSTVGRLLPLLSTGTRVRRLKHLRFKICHDSGNLTLSKEHLVFTVREESRRARAIPARDVRPGTLLLTSTEEESPVFSLVHNVYSTSMKGYYGPLTSTGTILVDNVVASCYTHDGNYKLPHWTLNLVMAPLRITALPLLSYIPGAGEIHPYARFLMKL